MNMSESSKQWFCIEIVTSTDLDRSSVRVFTAFGQNVDPQLDMPLAVHVLGDILLVTSRIRSCGCGGQLDNHVP